MCRWNGCCSGPRVPRRRPRSPGGPPAAEAGFRLPKLPVRGIFRLRSDSIRYDRWAVREVTASGELGPDRSQRVGSPGQTCAGSRSRAGPPSIPAGLAVELRTTASGKDLNQPMMCLFDKRVSMTGSFRFDTRLTARGRDRESLIRSIEGPVELTARDGRIYQWPLLSRILSVLNVTNVIRGRLPDMPGGILLQDLDDPGGIPRRRRSW